MDLKYIFTTMLDYHQSYTVCSIVCKAMKIAIYVLSSNVIKVSVVLMELGDIMHYVHSSKLVSTCCGCVSAF